MGPVSDFTWGTPWVCKSTFLQGLPSPTLVATSGPLKFSEARKWKLFTIICQSGLTAKKATYGFLNPYMEVSILVAAPPVTVLPGPPHFPPSSAHARPSVSAPCTKPTSPGSGPPAPSSALTEPGEQTEPAPRPHSAPSSHEILTKLLNLPEPQLPCL